MTPQLTPNPIKIGAFEALSTALLIVSDIDANTPVYQVYFNYILTDPFSLLSLPPMSSPLNYTTNTENNKDNNQDKSDCPRSS